MLNQNNNGWSTSRVVIFALVLLVLYQVRDSQLSKQRGVLNLQTQDANQIPTPAPAPRLQTLVQQNNGTDCRRANDTRKAQAKVNATQHRDEDRPDHHTVVLTDDELAELRALRARVKERAERAERKRRDEENEKARRIETERRAAEQKRATQQRLDDLRKQNEALLANTKPDQHTQSVFENIYTHKHWGSDGRGSGTGSSLESTRSIRSILERVIRQYNITSMLDIPCGGMLWMPHVIHSVRQNINANFQYHGADIVRNLVESHRQEFRGESPKLEFSVVDFTKQPLPKGYDMVFSRDALQHLPMSMAFQFLEKVKASGAKYLLVGSYIETHGHNHNINAGDYYDINLLEAPFNLATPLEMNKETTRQVQSDPTKYALLFEVEKMTWSRQ